MSRRLAALAVLALLATGHPAAAESWVSYTTDTAYDDVLFELQIAIEEQGYVIDSISHVGDMLNRTAADVGATRQLYEKADVYQFCSATLSREVMEKDLMNMAFCPYSVFAFQEAGSTETVVGYRTMPEGEMQAVQTLLDKLARQAAGVE